MKKLYIAALFLAMSIMSVAQISVWDGTRKLWIRGEGTESNPYLIESAENLAFLSYMVNKGFETQDLYFLLTTDIDLNGSEDQPWTPIGLGNNYFYEDGCDRTPDASFVPNNSFRGYFDGDDHKIYHLFIKDVTMGGLFGSVENSCEIKNIHVENGIIYNVSHGGGIIGKCATGAVITNCSNGTDISGNNAGGILGSGNASIVNCYNSGKIKGHTNAGGIVGCPGSHEISECYNTGEIISFGIGGGIVGNTTSRISIINCYNTGKVSGNAQYIGGIGGMVVKGSVKNCYNVGDIANSQGTTGGIIGSDFNGTADNIYYLNTCGGNGIGEAMTATMMRDEAFVATLNNGTDVWGYDENNVNDGFPILDNSILPTSEMATLTMCVYPNPAKGSFSIEGNGLLTITNILGQKIMEQNLVNHIVVTLPSGIYLIRLSDSISSTTRKIVVY